MTNEYCTIASVKSRLSLTTTTYDSELESVIEAVSRAIDAKTRRCFYATTDTRYYTAEFHDMLIVDDLLSVTTVQTDDDADDTYETTWTTDDYLLEPYNTTPYDLIMTSNNGDYSFPVGVRKGVKISGSFGYSATTPPAIEEACILASMRVWKRRDVLFGVAGSADLGTIQAITSVLNDGELRLLLESIPVRII